MSSATPRSIGPRWFLPVALVVATIIAVVTDLPVLGNPQVEADEFRYLAHIQALEADADFSFLDACIVENRWDGLWWVEPRAAVKFFRPLVFTSFYLNGDTSAGYTNLAVMNLLLHLVCCWLVVVLLFRVVGRGWPALLGGVLFAAMSCHGEAIWYFSGRNASLAALGFLAALLCHAYDRRYLALVPYLFALMAKESTIGLPLLCLLYDAWCRPERRSVVAQARSDWKLYASYAVVAAAWLVLRRLVAGPMPGGDHYPYLITPGNEHFASHLVTQFLSYSANLSLGWPTQPFMVWRDLIWVWQFWAGLVTFVVLAAGMVFVMLRDARARFALILGVVTWLPTSFVYISERYLYMPSIGWCLAFALVLDRFLRVRTRREVQVAALVVAVTMTVFGWQIFMLRHKHVQLSQERVTTTITAKLKEVLPANPGDKTLVFLHFPGDWVQSQFLESQLRMRFRRHDLRAIVLSGISLDPARIRPIDAHTIEVSGDVPFFRPASSILPNVDFSPGKKYSAPGVEIEVLEGDGANLQSARYRFERPLDQLKLIRFLPDPRHMPRYDPRFETDWIRNGRFQVVPIG